MMNYENFLNGNKKITEADRKFIATYIAPKLLNAENEVISNPFTGESFEVNPLISKLVQFTQELIYTDFGRAALKKWGVSEGAKIQLFDRARMIILKLNNAVYMAVID